MKKSCATAVVSALSSIGVRTIFTLSGNQIMPIFDACIDADIKLVHVRHEAAAVYMAEAWAQLNGDIGVALIPAGPGFANGLSPLYSARASESPVLLLSGDSPLHQDSMGAFQALDQVSISKPLTKRSRRPQAADEILTELVTAIQIARSGRPGPVHLALPFDLLQADLSDDLSEVINEAQREVNSPDIQAIKKIASSLESAERPVILTGPALSQTRADTLISNLQTNLGMPVISMENPRGLKDPALGNLGEILEKADTVLFLGKAVDFTVNFGQPPAFHTACQFFVIDPEQALLAQAQRALASKLVISHRADADLAAIELAQFRVHQTGKHQDWHQQVIDACA